MGIHFVYLYMKYISHLKEDDSSYVVYTITAKYEDKTYLYIGSSTEVKVRYRQHFSDLKGDRHHSKFLQRVFNKYPDLDLTFESRWSFSSEKEMIEHEGVFIRLFKPEFNGSLFPEVSGKPNYKKKLNDEWRSNLNNGGYTHTESGNLERISKQNKKGGTSVKFTNRITGEVMIFDTMKSVNEHFGTKYYITRLMNPGCRLHKQYIIELLKTQTKRVHLYKGGKFLKEFDTAGECDLYLDVWRGATSNAINNFGKLHEYEVMYV